MDGVIESSFQGVVLGSKTVMPTAGAGYESCIILYIGETDDNYTQNRFYQCQQSSGSYAWVQIEVSEGTDLSNYVTKSTTVAGHPLSTDVVITPEDIGAVPTARTVNGQSLDEDVDITLASLGGVPDTRTVNTKPLSSDIVLDSSDVGAIDDSYLSTAKPVSTSTDTEIPTSKAVYSAIEGVEDAISTEAVTRSNADNSIQQQIDALVAKSDVVDIVGTKAELDDYDTSKLGNNDIVKVISDNTHEDMTTYYRWVIASGTGSWEYIGGEGPYLTVASASATYVPKTTTINAKALTTNITLDASDVSAIPSSYLSTAPPSSESLDTQVPTSKAVHTIVNTKQDKLTFDSAPTSGSSNPVTSGGILTALTNGTVTKVGTATKGSASLPIYLNAGVPTAITMGSVASGNNAPVTGGAVYNACTNGTVTKVGTATKGSSVLPIYLNAGVPTAVTLGSIASGNTGLVTGGTVFTYINNIFEGSY